MRCEICDTDARILGDDGAINAASVGRRPSRRRRAARVRSMVRSRRIGPGMACGEHLWSGVRAAGPTADARAPELAMRRAAGQTRGLSATPALVCSCLVSRVGSRCAHDWTAVWSLVSLRADRAWSERDIVIRNFIAIRYSRGARYPHLSPWRTRSAIQRAAQAQLFPASRPGAGCVRCPRARAEKVNVSCSPRHQNACAVRRSRRVGLAARAPRRPAGP